MGWAGSSAASVLPEDFYIILSSQFMLGFRDPIPKLGGFLEINLKRTIQVVHCPPPTPQLLLYGSCNGNCVGHEFLF